MNLQKRFDKDGFVILRKVFTKNEIEDIRMRCYEQLEMDQKNKLDYKNAGEDVIFTYGDLLTKDLLHKLVYEPRILDYVRMLIGEQMVYFGESHYEIGTGSSVLERANADKEFRSGPDWDGNYNLIQVGLYLQDHNRYSGGPVLSVGSHQKKKGPFQFASLEEGDLIIWNLRLMKYDNALRLKIFPEKALNISPRFIPAFLKKEQQKERVALFISYGIQDEKMKRYCSKKFSDTGQGSGLKWDAYRLAIAGSYDLRVISPRKEFQLTK